MSVKVTVEYGGEAHVYECEFAAVGVIRCTAGDTMCEECWAKDATRLADLIEPAQDHFVEPDEKVDRDALLNLAGELDRVGFNDWLHSGEWEPEEIARRIRKALGAAE